LLNHCLLVRCTFVTNEHYEHTFSVKKTNFIQSFKTLSIRVGSGRAQEFRPVQIFSPDQYACLLQLLLQYFPHSVTNWIQIWRIWRPQLRWQKFQSFFKQLNGNTCTKSNFSASKVTTLWRYTNMFISTIIINKFHNVMQRVILFRWGGKRLFA